MHPYVEREFSLLHFFLFILFDLRLSVDVLFFHALKDMIHSQAFRFFLKNNLVYYWWSLSYMSFFVILFWTLTLFMVPRVGNNLRQFLGCRGKITACPSFPIQKREIFIIKVMPSLYIHFRRKKEEKLPTIPLGQLMVVYDCEPVTFL